MSKSVRMAVMGAGLIGKRHIEHVMASDQATLSAIVDPSPVGKALAALHRVPWFADFGDMIAAGRPEGVIIATPNQVHVANGIAAIKAGIPALVEKPIADTVASAEQLVAAAEAARVPLLIGHHRRHNPMIQRAKAIIDSGKLGRIITVHGFFWLLKPDDYFAPQWRREKGAGPVFMNLIHDVDLLRFLVGEVTEVVARESSAVRGHAVEDAAVMLLTFANGALGTVNVSDSVVAPWSWEQTTGENPVYPHTDQTCYFIGGTHGSLSIPRLEVWSNAATRSWWEPFTTERTIAADADPLRLQVDHFARVIRGEAAPLVSGREGLNTLKVIEAVKASAQSGQAVALG